MLIINNRILLLSIASLLIALNWHFSEYNSTYLLFWCAALSIAWRRKDELKLESNIFATAIGLFLISWLLFRGAVNSNEIDVLTIFYPTISVLGICLLASKATSIKQYWKEITIVALTGIPWEHLLYAFSITEKTSIFDAQISRTMLWYAGFDVHQVGNLVVLPTGTIKIAGACSSVALLGLMLQSCLVMCLYFTVTKKQKIVLLSCATLIAFGVNGIRLCLMALLVANDAQDAFKYWHGDEGAEIFTTGAILLLAGIYWLLIRKKEKHSLNASTIHEQSVKSEKTI